MINDQTRASFESSYRSAGIGAQRRYPNEELLRFFGIYYFDLAREDRKQLRVLEVGCGSGANLWMIAREGFEAHGIDLSPEGLALCERMLKAWETSAALKPGDMTALDYPDDYFHILVDVFSSYCLCEKEFECFLDEAARVVHKGGRFFFYSPSKNSDAFRDHAPSRLIDASTLNAISRTTSPFYPQNYPFRFIAPDEFAAMLEQRGFRILRNERIGRTYRDGSEYFEFVSIHAEKTG